MIHEHISVLIPSRKEPRILETIHSVEECFPKAQIIIANDRYGKGKGWAIREALSHATNNIIVFIDGDMDIHPRMIKRLLYHLDEFDIVVGKKDTRKMFSRWILTLLSRAYIWLLFRVPVDTQTGVKVFWREALPDWEDDSFAFDIEILAKAKKAGRSMFEVTVDAGRSKNMKFKSIFQTLLGSLHIYKRKGKQRGS